MRHEFRLQDPGEGIAEVEINEILVSEGDEIAEGEEVLVVESDKAAIELPSPYSGRVAEIAVSAGDTVQVGDVLMVVEGAAERGAAPGREKKPDRKKEAEEAENKTSSDDDEERAGTIEGDGPRRGEVTATKTAEQPGAGNEPKRDDRGGGSDKAEGVRAAPAARKLARERDIDLAEVEATGPDGEVTVGDVETAFGGTRAQAREKGKEPAARQQEADHEPAREEVGDEDGFGPVERVPLRSIRAATARAMARAWSEIPHVVHQDMADITDLERWRRRTVAEEGDPNLTLTPIVAKAVVGVLRKHPRFNATFDAAAGEIVLRRYYNVNVAVATPKGLITPVLHDADRKPIRALASELAALADEMRTGRPSKEHLTGGTFTITNVGGLGGTAFSPLINPPQTAILGLARARLMPVVTGDFDDLDHAETRVRLMLPLILAFDHRVIDGADAAAFVNALAELLGDAKRLALDV